MSRPVSPTHAKTGLVFLGDVMPGRHMRTVLDKKPVKDVLAPLFAVTQGRHMMANLECPFSERPPLAAKGRIQFHAPLSMGRQLDEAGFSGFSLANNHIFDCGVQAAIDTREALESLGMFAVGAGSDAEQASAPAIVDCDGVAVGMAAFSYAPAAGEATPGVASMRSEAVDLVVSELKKQVDVIVLQFHSGVELLQYPLPRDVALYRRAADLGADLVVGSHSHCIQVMETWNGTPIYYGLGDCIFDHHHPDVWRGFWRDSTHPTRYNLTAERGLPKMSLAVTVDFSEKGLVVEPHPVQLCGEGVLALLDGDALSAWRSHYAKLHEKWTSQEVQTQVRDIENDILRQLAKRGPA